MPVTGFLQYYFDLLPIVVALFFLFTGKKIELLLWVILFYSAYSFANNTKLVYDSGPGQDALLPLYIFTVVEYLLFAIFIYCILSNILYKRTLFTCSVLFVAFCLINIFFQPKFRFDSLQTSIEILILLIFCILFLFEQINKPETLFIYASYKFWVITGILIYLASTLFLYGFAASLPTEVREQFWFISHISNILRNIFFTIAIIINVRTPKQPIIQKPPEKDFLPYLN
jgi:hypothetical protein